MMNNFHFGTDGIRGEYGVFPMTEEAIYHFTCALISWFKDQQSGEISGDLSLMVARDTRCSGEALHRVIVKAAKAKEVTVLDLGIAPTPALAWLMRQHRPRVNMGLMISASHNPWQDNGIKIFTSTGEKLSAKAEKTLSAFINCYRRTDVHEMGEQTLTPVKNASSLLASYREHLLSVYHQYLQIQPCQPWHIVVDTAHGALYQVAYQVLDSLNHQITAIGNQPNGENINQQCGSTYTRTLSQAVVDSKADFGVCFDGDGDRIILCDSQGRIIDGDGVLYYLAPLFGNSKIGIVGTQMTNGFVEKYLRQLNIPFTRTFVGDKYIAEALYHHKWRLGGESSGHILIPEHGPCGDALLVFLIVLAVLSNRGVDAKETFDGFCPYPQTLINLPVSDKTILQRPMIQQTLTRFKQNHPEDIILVRPSGTENVIRIMVESVDKSTSQDLCSEIAEMISTHSV